MSSCSLELTHYDLVTPDGILTHWDPNTSIGTVVINEISPNFVGFDIDLGLVTFNLKSALAQLGVDAETIEISLMPKSCSAEAKIRLVPYGVLATKLLALFEPGLKIGKLFAADDRRRVRDPVYLSRMFGRSDRFGRPLLSLGGLQGSTDLILEKVEGRTVAYLSLQNGVQTYNGHIEAFLPSFILALKEDFSLRNWVRLHQTWHSELSRSTVENEILLVRTRPLHVRTVFGRVCQELLPKGFRHTSASVLQPDTSASGDIYELFGSSDQEITDIPLEFYTLEPYREHVFFEDRDQLLSAIDKPETLTEAFSKAPPAVGDMRSAVYIVKGKQLDTLQPSDWVARESHYHEFPGVTQTERQALMVERYIEQQPSFPILKAIDEGLITSQGILLTRYLPTPLMKRMLLSNQVQRSLKGIYFQYPSQSSESFFSAEDRALLHDLEKFAIPVYWVDRETSNILRYVQKEDKDSGLFVPLDKVEDFLRSSIFGIYGSNLEEGDFEAELEKLFNGVIELQKNSSHIRLNPKTPLALVTGGGPGAMEVGNRVAKKLSILSCANIVDFRQKDAVVNEQKTNPFIDAKMTYRLDKIIERQAEFNLDFPIFLKGGIGTDFEFTLEEVRRKVGMAEATPIILFGSEEYWGAKLTSRFKCNQAAGTIVGSEWLTNCFYCAQTAEEALLVYKKYLDGTLEIGKHGPVYERGFAIGKFLYSR